MPARDARAWTVLLRGYAQLGHVHHTWRLFATCPSLDAVTWNVAIGALASSGLLVEAVELFYGMLCVGENPSEATYAAAISACVHLGLVEESQRQFRSMVLDLGRAPNVKLYSSMADLLGRAGEVAASKELVESMPFASDAVVEGAMLGACKIHGDHYG
ncbi:hypothetical protein SELMODRAFT_123384 [Selaginella moellendorffii]|uniref:Pentacotripeptide-repeat region of PRORP domain-containing protein n=2 Tax=Selaginella moellendorffii TaxID=88036 RepID=D8SRP2_SELML|nr:hypothetical protein SELMODRAFT_123384 [Selaginella moellendorffii]